MELGLIKFSSNQNPGLLDSNMYGSQKWCFILLWWSKSCSLCLAPPDWIYNWLLWVFSDMTLKCIWHRLNAKILVSNMSTAHLASRNSVDLVLFCYISPWFQFLSSCISSIAFALPLAPASPSPPSILVCNIFIASFLIQTRLFYPVLILSTIWHQKAGHARSCKTKNYNHRSIFRSSMPQQITLSIA